MLIKSKTDQKQSQSDPRNSPKQYKPSTKPINKKSSHNSPHSIHPRQRQRVQQSLISLLILPLITPKSLLQNLRPIIHSSINPTKLLPHHKHNPHNQVPSILHKQSTNLIKKRLFLFKLYMLRFFLHYLISLK